MRLTLATATFASLALALAACASDEEAQAAPDAPAPASPAPTDDASSVADGGPRTDVVSGTVKRINVTDSGDVEENFDLRGTGQLGAFLLKGDGYVEIRATQDTAGAITLEGVPEGETYFLRLGTGIYQSKARTFAARFPYLGRKDVLAARTGANVAFSLSGMAPWGANDFLSLASSNAGLALYGYLSFPGMPAVPTSTTTLGVTVDHSLASPNWLVDPGRGDSTLFLHQAQKPASLCWTAVDQFAAPTFAVKNDQTTQVAGAFVPVAQSETFQLAWKRSTYAPHVASLHPSAALSFANTGVYALPGSDRFGVYSLQGNGAVQEGINLAACYEYSGSADSALSVSYGKPLPASYALSVLTRESYTVMLAAPGAAPAPIDARFVQWQPMGTSDVELVVSPPKNLRIAGKEAWSKPSGVSTTPLVTWEAPAVGTASRYSVNVGRLFAKAGATNKEVVLIAKTLDASFRIPPGSLHAGETYYVEVSAEHFPTLDEEALRFGAFAVPGAEANVLSSEFSP